MRLRPIPVSYGRQWIWPRHERGLAKSAWPRRSYARLLLAQARIATRAISSMRRGGKISGAKTIRSCGPSRRNTIQTGSSSCTMASAARTGVLTALRACPNRLGTRLRPAGSGVHQHRGVIALKPLNRTPVGVVNEALGDLVGAGGEVHTEDDVVGGAGRVLGEQLLDDASEAMRQLIHEPQVSGVMHLFEAWAIGAAGLFGKLMQKEIQQPRLVHQAQLRIELDLRSQVHDALPSRSS